MNSNVFDVSHLQRDFVPPLVSATCLRQKRHHKRWVAISFILQKLWRKFFKPLDLR